jgi:uncharacterized membrane protein
VRRMPDSQRPIAVCQICNQQKDVSEMLPAATVSGPVLDTIRRHKPDLSADGYICLDDLNRFRAEHVRDLLSTEGGELSALQQEVVESMKQGDLLSRNINREFDQRLTFGQRLADKIADFGGSWAFISIFFFILLFWVTLNAVLLRARPYDPYPFILLNLILSCLAAVQAPVIMMSQNRQEAKDRLRGENDYRVNLKAELEIRTLHSKLDLLLTHQWQRLLEIQQIQTEMMEELARHTRAQS